MELTGRIENGAVVLDDAQVLPEGAIVRIVIVKEQPEYTTLGERLMRFAGRAEGLPEDFAKNHDHYLHGAPKK